MPVFFLLHTFYFVPVIILASSLLCNISNIIFNSSRDQIWRMAHFVSASKNKLCSRPCFEERSWKPFFPYHKVLKPTDPRQHLLCPESAPGQASLTNKVAQDSAPHKLCQNHFKNLPLHYRTLPLDAQPT